MSTPKTDVQNFYAGKTIFITGVTGFLGHILLSKLLCSCSELRCIYVMIREKPQKLVHQRLRKLFDDPIFDRAKELNPDFETKVRPIRGNSYENDLGISDNDRAILENEVEIIFHVAATVNFKTSLREAAYINVRSLDILLDMAKKMKNFKAFAYTSTALSPCTQTQYIEEKFYESPMKTRALLSLLKCLDDHILEELTPCLIRPYPNTYIYTKLIAEDLCREKGSELPLCIFRPGMVIPCDEEPARGWINNLYGIIGVSFGHALGILKFFHLDKSSVAFLCPGDYTVNALIVSTYYTGKLWESRASREVKFDVPIVNYSNSTSKSAVTWGGFVLEWNKALKKYPFYNIFTLPSIILTNNKTVYRVLKITLHLLPAVIIDAGLMALGKTPRLKKMYDKMHEFMDMLVYFSTNNWIISTNKVDELWARLSAKDKTIFYFNFNDINVEQYYENMVRGVRLYLAKEEEHSVEKAKRKHKIFLIVYYIIAAIFILIFSNFLINRFNFA